eukprot:894647-Pelagomonas_calceolata.AAC.1
MLEARALASLHLCCGLYPHTNLCIAQLQRMNPALLSAVACASRAMHECRGSSSMYNGRLGACSRTACGWPHCTQLHAL